jgi:hypothetical protein
VVGVSGPGDQVEEYLDLLYTRLRTSPRQARRVLAEAEDHLREATADAVAAGMSEREAQEAAISSFGSVRAVVRAHDARLRRFPALAVAADLVMSAGMLAGVGLLAVGVSGLVAQVMNAAFGPRYVGAVPSGATFPAAACRSWLADIPAVHSCAQAAMLETSGDAVRLRLLAGIAGLVVLAGYYLAGRRLRAAVLPDGFVAAVAVSLFGVTGLGLALLAVNQGVVGVSSGPGFFLSGAIVSLATAAVFVPSLRRALVQHARGSAAQHVHG